MAVAATAQIPGRNVNMVSGTKWPDGDPFLQRQNEPSMAVSTRNPLHLLAGANDYRTVDLPGLPDRETGDAWLGVFKSYDGGQTWRSTVHPGCPQNVPACDGAPFLKNYTAGADPVVRAGSNGMFYFSGIAFTRDTPLKSTVFISRFIDNNNEENGDPIKYAGSVSIDAGKDKQFIDKPWLAVDVPRAGAATCTISTTRKDGTTLQQKFPAGNLYVSYSIFTDESKPPSQILFARSQDCGATWSKPIVFGDNALNQGSTIAIDPASGAVYVAWRRFKSEGVTAAMMIVKSTDGGQTFGTPLEVATINPFDQGTTFFSFRTNAYPTIAVDGSGRVYLAWAERGFAMANDARIVLTTSRDGQKWTPRAPVNNFNGRGHQFMPAMTFAGGKLVVVYYDLRDDNTFGVFKSLGQGQYLETRQAAGDLATIPPHPEKVFTDFLLDAAPADLNEGGLLRRHTLDVWASQANPTDVPAFTAARVSQYVFGSRPGNSVIEQLQLNPPNLPLFKQGSAAFFGDYLDVTASPSMIPGDQPGSWKFNTDASSAVAFHAVWTDNRDVRPPANGDWTDYTPPFSASSAGLSVFDPSKPQPVCRTGQAGMRNQNIYTARISQGLLVGSPSNTKILGKLQRAFPLVVTNSTSQPRSYRLTILNQPRGGKTSFLQVAQPGLPDPLLTIDVSLPPVSSASRMVFVRSADPLAQVRVSVDEIAAVGADQITQGGLAGTIVLNPDPANPDDPAVAASEVFNPDIVNPDIVNPDIVNPDIVNPDIVNPDIVNPDIVNPDIVNPDIVNPDIVNPDIVNPDIVNPDIVNPDIVNSSISDATWKVSNTGNSTATYSLRFLLGSGTVIPSRIKLQLILHRGYATPVANGCNLTEEPHTVVVANIPRPKLLTQQTAARLMAMIARSRARSPQEAAAAYGASEILDDSPDSATVSVGPGETVYVTMRFLNTDNSQPLGFDPGEDINTVVISNSTNSDGTTGVAATHLLLATSALPSAFAGKPYSAGLVAAGGVTPYTFGITGGSLPPGLSLDTATGAITGTVANNATGTYTFTVQVTDSSPTPKTAVITESLSIAVSRVALSVSSLVAAAPGGSFAKPGDTITVTATVLNSGDAADDVAPGIGVNVTGTAGASCSAPSPASAPIAAAGSQVYTFGCGSVSGTGTLSFSVSLTATDHVSGAGVLVSPATSNAITVLGTPPLVAVSATAGGAPYSGDFTNKDVVVTFTCTPAVGDPIAKTVTVTSDGANQTVSNTCTDLAGNTATGKFSGINIDKTPPQLNIVATAGGAPYNGGWTNQDVTVKYQCSDPGGSGVVSKPGDDVFSAEGANQVATGFCIDAVGNKTTDTFTVDIDKTPPVIQGSASPGPSAAGWSSGPVSVTFTCTDALSGVPSGQPTGNTTVSGDTGGTTVSGSCTDRAGNLATGQVGP
ncbi:MAG TPA: putative Ig domain-containing protein, partial [Bryobacteraceae bacterium]